MNITAIQECEKLKKVIEMPARKKNTKQQILLWFQIQMYISFRKMKRGFYLGKMTSDTIEFSSPPHPEMIVGARIQPESKLGNTLKISSQNGGHALISR